MGKAKYSVEEKLAWVTRILSNEITPSQAAKMSGINDMAIIDWLRLYEVEGIQGLVSQSHNRSYPVELKRMAVEEYLAGGISLRQICKKYKVRDIHLLREWIKRYNSGKSFGRKMSGGSRMKKARKTSQEERIQIVKACMERGSTMEPLPWNTRSATSRFTPGYKNIRNWEKPVWKTAVGNGRLPKRPGQRLKNFVLR